MAGTVANPAWWWNNDAFWQSIGYANAKEGQEALGITKPILDPEEVVEDPHAGQHDGDGETFPVRSVNDISYLSDVYRYNNFDYLLKRRNFISLRNFFDSQLKWSEFTPVVDFRYAEVDYVYHVAPGDLVVRYESFMPNIVGVVDNVPEIEITELTEYKEAIINVLFPRFPAVGEMVVGDPMRMDLSMLKASRFTYVIRSTMSSAGNLFRVGYETAIRGILPS